MIGIIYTLFSWIDSIVYGLAASLFRIIFDLADMHFFSDAQIQEVTTRVYIVVGVLMLFKLVISAVQYLVNPDSFDDKEKGLGGLLKKTAVSMALIAIVPTIFQFLMAVQGPIIKTLPSVILGSNPSETIDDKSIDFDLSFQILSTFVRAKPGTDGSVSDAAGTTVGEIHDFSSFTNKVGRNCPYGILDWSSADNCVYDYKIIISTICGGFLCYTLLTMVLDISIRVIKMSIIEMLAPIPISSYIVSKDKLNKFVKTASSVYFDLFIRMGIIYFIIFAIKAIKDSKLLGFSTNSGDVFRDIVINIALIFGLLMFASKAPKFLSELLGLPEVGSGDMADMFKPAWQRVGGFATAGAMIGAYRNSKEYGEKKHVRLGRVFSAGAHATATRLREIASGKSLEESYKTAKDAASARTNKNLEYANRYPKLSQRVGQVWKERYDNYTGVMTGGKKASATIEAANRAINARNKAWSRAQDKVGEHANWYNGTTFIDKYTDAAGKVHEFEMDFEKMYALFEKDGTEMYEGQKVKLASKYQEMKDAASVDFLTQSFAYGEHGDAQARNEFSENVYSIIRSGADNKTLDRLLTIDLGDGKTIFAGDVAERVEKMNKALEGITDKAEIKRKMKELTDAKIAFTASEARAIAEFAKNLNKTGGNVRLEATKTQTTAPKDS